MFVIRTKRIMRGQEAVGERGLAVNARGAPTNTVAWSACLRPAKVKRVRDIFEALNAVRGLHEVDTNHGRKSLQEVYSRCKDRMRETQVSENLPEQRRNCKIVICALLTKDPTADAPLPALRS